jgi:serine protease Do
MRKAIVVVTCGVGIAIGIIIGGLGRSPLPEPACAETKAAHNNARLEELRDFADKLSELFRTVAESVSPSVVYISSSKTVKFRTPGMMRDPFFERFFGQDPFGADPFFGPQEREFKQQGLGTGFIVEPQGLILTNYHVVADADELKVTLNDGRSVNAKRVGQDERNDLAVIKLEGEFKDLPCAKLGDSDEIKVGDWVIAIGNPFGFEHTVSTGIISGKGRKLAVGPYEYMIQTDAAINPGNSGGPLLNLRGEVIGINTAIFSRTGGYQGIGFAIPVNVAKDSLPYIKEGKQPERGYLGISGGDLTSELAAQFDYKTTKGALVSEVIPDTPAEKAGLKAGDIIMQWNGKEVDNFSHLRQLVAATEPGKEVKLKVWRDGKELTLELKVARLTEQEVSVVIVEVMRDSPAAQAGLEPGDAILAVNRQPVASVADFNKAMAKTSADKGVLLRIVDCRTGRIQFVFIRGG